MQNERFIVLNEELLRNNWDFIKDDEYFHYDGNDVEEFINAVKQGNVYVGGAKLLLQNKLEVSIENEDKNSSK